jgi:hypothetical protein
MKPAKLTDTQKIFLLAKINGTDNRQDRLPHNGWTWPRGWLAHRLEYLDQIRKERADEQD